MVRARVRTVRRLLLATALVGALALGGCPGAEERAAPGSSPSAQTIGAGGPLEAIITLSATSITTAQRLELRVDVTLDAGMTLQEIDLKGVLPEGMDAVELTREERPEIGSERMSVRRVYRIDPFLPGEFEIAPFEIRATRDETKAGEPAASSEPVVLKSSAIPFNVATVLAADDADLAAEKSIVEPPPEPLPWGWIAGGACLLALALVLIIRRVLRPAPPPPPVFRMAHELAIERLEALLALRLTEAGRFKEFHARASDIFRRYIEDRFGLHAPERTTEEFLAEARASYVLNPEQSRVVEAFLTRCDMVKFAGVASDSNESSGIASMLRGFFEQTRDEARLVEITPASREDPA